MDGNFIVADDDFVIVLFDILSSLIFQHAYTLIPRPVYSIILCSLHNSTLCLVFYFVRFLFYAIKKLYVTCEKKHCLEFSTDSVVDLDLFCSKHRITQKDPADFCSTSSLYSQSLDGESVCSENYFC